MRRSAFGLLSIFFLHANAFGQFAGEESWNELFVYEGVRFLYVFYPRADTINDGVVMMLQNQNDYGVNYTFTVIFESWEGTASKDVEGSLKPMEMKTGDVEGLFWIPFDDGRSIGAIRMRNYRVTPANQSSS